MYIILYYSVGSSTLGDNHPLLRLVQDVALNHARLLAAVRRSWRKLAFVFSTGSGTSGVSVIVPYHYWLASGGGELERLIHSHSVTPSHRKRSGLILILLIYFA